MAYRDEDDELDPEGPDSVDQADGDDDQDLLTPCPHCKQMMYEDTERCPHCGDYVSPDRSGGLPLWAIVTAVICLAVFIFLAIR
ncbi:MAG: hypothetical protein JWM57_4385 [Phycisphaerales bacterium]|nr:hypothetical protein [Phycisphaerales bacterium]